MNEYMLHSKLKIRGGATILRALLAWIALTGFAATAARGQYPTAAPKPTPPPRPLLNPAPEFSKWMITLSYPDDDAAKAKGVLRSSSEQNAPRRILTTKTREIIHEEIVDVSGGKIDKWQVGGTFYVFSSDQKYWGEYAPDDRKNSQTGDAASSAVPGNGFRGLGWIDSETYAGSIKQSNAVYLVFVPSGASNLDLNDLKSLEAQPTIAYVDEASRLPALFKKDGVTQSYSFLAPPSAMQTLPADLAKSIRDGNEARAKVFAAPHAE
jgi:hypothetical protein